MSSLPEWVFCHRVTIEPYRGRGAYGEVYDTPVPDVPALAAYTVKRVRNPTGDEVTSTAQIYAAPGLDCPAGSRITLPDGRTTKAVQVSPHTAPGLGLPECTEVSCE
ncbi:hypothetical protein QA943_18840 [Streptomyces sp. B21-097]|uniref:hypothetical protein n=1 Tax=Streptomyces sp. B21-097 TaxID=3039414 RepID=UPI002FF34A64